MQLKFFDFLVRGIDISAYDRKLIVEKLIGKVHFVIVRIGHGTKTDAKFKEFWALLKGKIFRIGYFYLDYYSNYLPEYPYVYGKSDYEWGVIQGKNAWENIKGDHDTKLIYLDVEQGDREYAPEIDDVWDRVETNMDGFFDTYDALSGIVNGIYASLSRFKWFSPRFRHRPAYVAWYDEDADGKERTRESVIAEMRAIGWTGPIHFWQYASDGDTGTDGAGDGLEFGLGRKVMDLDVWMGTEEEWETFRKSLLIPDGNSQDAAENAAEEQPMTDILLDIAPLAQRDPRWKDHQLGTSDKTIGSHGCVITDATMMCRHFGIDIDPAGMNTWLKANGGYQNTNWFYWYVLNKLDPRISFGHRYEYAALDKVDAQLAKGIPSIVNVDLIPATSVLDEHWVLVVGKVGGSYIINDPWYGTQFKFEEKYGNPKTGMRIVCTYNFAGEVAPIPEPEPETALYRVRVTVPDLLIRSAPNESASVVKRYASGEYDVFEEVQSVKYLFGRIGAGRWIALKYTERVGASLEERVTALEKAVFGE